MIVRTDIEPFQPAAGALPGGAAREIARLDAGAFAGRFANGRLFLQHGPINLVVHIEGEADAREMAEQALLCCFPGWLGTLVPELARLRQRETDALSPPGSIVGQAMVRAVQPFVGQFVTPMAAVAGAIADAAADTIERIPGIRRAWINNGGDIALVLAPGESVSVGLMTSDRASTPAGTLRIEAESPIRGVATSGWRGRSHSLGVADAVTVLAGCAARADAAATVIASATCIDSPAVQRVPASELDEDSDLGHRPVTVGVDELDDESCAAALRGGLAVAREAHANGAIRGAALCVQGRWACVGDPAGVLPEARDMGTPRVPRHGPESDRANLTFADAAVEHRT